MTDLSNKPQAVLACGDRIQLCDETLQAFYGHYGTVLHVRHCPRSGQIARVAVQMDDVPANEGYALFTPAQLRHERNTEDEYRLV